MDLLSITAGVFGAFGVLVLVMWCLHRVVVWARRQDKKAYVVGAALAPFIGLGNVGDPDFRIVHEAKQTKKREEDEPGDPPNADDDEPAASQQPGRARDLTK